VDPDIDQVLLQYLVDAVELLLTKRIGQLTLLPVYKLVSGSPVDLHTDWGPATRTAPNDQARAARVGAVGSVVVLRNHAFLPYNLLQLYKKACFIKQNLNFAL
jgi:hypothetical protein